MDINKVKFINEYEPSKGGLFTLNEEINELYDNREGLTVDDFKDRQNSVFDKETGEEYICGFPVVYQVTAHGNIPSIFKNGFDRAFTSSKGGNMYGPGTYSTYRLASTEKNVRHGIYGDTFVKMLVLSKFKDFLIYDENIAKKVHGKNWNIKNQFVMFFGPEMCNEFKKRGIWDLITRIHEHTSQSAYNVWRMIGDRDLIKAGVNGFIFFGGHDGFVSVIRDFKNILPIAYSTDRGRTWKNDIFTQDTINTIFYDVDARTFLGKEVDKYRDTDRVGSALNKRINNLIMVRTKDGKYNFIDISKNMISPLVNFDSASPIRENGLAYVTINDHRYVKTVGEPFEGYVSEKGVHYEEDPDDYIPWDKFNNYLKRIGF